MSDGGCGFTLQTVPVSQPVLGGVSTLQHSAATHGLWQQTLLLTQIAK